MLFNDRQEAGKKLAVALAAYKDLPDVVVVALPRGGVSVAHEVAMGLNAPLEVFITRKIGVPGDPELAAGAIAENGDVFLDEQRVEDYAIHPLYLEQCIAERRKQIADLQRIYRGGRPMLELKDRIVILIDDGIATGATARTALSAIRKEGVRKLILAVPVLPLDAIDEFKALADEVIALSKPFPFFSVGAYYSRFDQLSDQEVREMLQSSAVGTGRG